MKDEGFLQKQFFFRVIPHFSTLVGLSCSLSLDCTFHSHWTTPSIIIGLYCLRHIRDLLVSRSSNNKYYQQDLDLLTRICGKHFLQFEDKVMARYLIDVPDLDLVIQFLSDPLAPVPCPMMQIVVRDNCKQATEKMMRHTASN